MPSEAASPPTDVALEASALAEWWGRVHDRASAAGHAAKTGELAAYLARDLDPDELDFDEDEDVDELDDAEVFVEVKAARFLAALNLPLPDGLPN